jgi:hypothetical protein
MIAALGSLVLFFSTFFIRDPWPGTWRRAVQNGLGFGALSLGAVAIGFGVWGWRRSGTARAAVWIVGSAAALLVIVFLALLTEDWQ